MKITLLSKFLILVLTMMIPMWFLGPGVFTKNFGSEKSDNLESLKKKAPKGVKTVVTDKEVVIYKWRDEHGVMQFSSVSPAEVDKVERVVLSPDMNVIDAFKIPEKEDKVVQKPNVISLGSPYSPEGMKDMINGSLNLQEQMTGQQAEQEKMMEELFKQK